MKFSEENIYATCPSILSMITKNEDGEFLANAKEFLHGRYFMDRVEDRIQVFIGEGEEEIKEGKRNVAKQPLLSDEDIELLSFFGEHTIECILVHVLSQLFHIETYISLASLIDRIEVAIRPNCPKKSLRQNDEDLNKSDNKKSKIRKGLQYPFGTALVEFLIQRGLITINTFVSNNAAIVENEEGKPSIVSMDVNKKKKKSFYTEKSHFVECTFNTALLPVKLNLPMVCPPKEWDVYIPGGRKGDKTPLSLSELYGGYLGNLPGELYNSYRIISSPDIRNFQIYFDKDPNIANSKAEKLCSNMNYLQQQPFLINVAFLKFIREEMALMVHHGYLLPEFLCNIHLTKASKLLHGLYMKSTKIQGLYKYRQLLDMLTINMQQSRYEVSILTMAKAYEKYLIYFPAFMDFRGRIYRSGIFHFHERDIARSLILLCENMPVDSRAQKEILFLTATSYHIESFQKEIDGYNTLVSIFHSYNNEGYSLYDIPISHILKRVLTQNDELLSRQLKHPLQFLSNIVQYIRLGQEKEEHILYNTAPITQDASASAYQILSYLLLDTEMGTLTNLLESRFHLVESRFHEVIHDIYENLSQDLTTYISQNELEDSPIYMIAKQGLLNRKFAKKVFMPIVYGKTVGSTAQDLYTLLSQYVSSKGVCYKLASICSKFWKLKYPGISVLMSLYGNIGRMVSSMGKPVQYSTSNFYTSQEYREQTKNTIYVYDRIARKRRSVTLSSTSNKSDLRKTGTASFVNVIHQIDAFIAMKMVEFAKKLGIPIYTVHDNFISNTLNCDLLPELYCSIFRDLGPPLARVNDFIYENLLEPAIRNGYFHDFGYNKNRKIDPRILSNCLKSLPKPINVEKKRWTTYINKIIHGYNEYCSIVCRSPDQTYYRSPDQSFSESLELDWEAHMQKWNRFKSQIKGKNCIHH